MLSIYHEAQRKSHGVVCGVEEEHREEHRKEDQGTPFRQLEKYTSDPYLCHDVVIKRRFTVKEIPQQKSRKNE